MCSWIRGSKGENSDVPLVPSIPKIQETLVSMRDKNEGFPWSRKWIGSVEVGLVIDKLHNVPGKILHIPSGSKLVNHTPELERHFTVRKSPIMMGRESDNSSKGIIGIAKSSKTSQCFLLILDPHYLFTSDEAQRISASSLQNQGLISWRDISTLHQNTFYNLCLPQTWCLTLVSVGGFETQVVVLHSGTNLRLKSERRIEGFNWVG